LRAGRVTMDATRQALLTRHNGATLVMEVAGAGDTALKRVAARFPGGESATVELQPDGWWRVVWPVDPCSDLRDAVAAEVARQGWRLRAVNVTLPPLEGVLADCVAGRVPEMATRLAGGQT